jgi:hypothetical protein
LKLAPGPNCESTLAVKRHPTWIGKSSKTVHGSSETVGRIHRSWNEPLGPHVTVNYKRSEKDILPD